MRKQPTRQNPKDFITSAYLVTPPTDSTPGNVCVRSRPTFIDSNVGDDTTAEDVHTAAPLNMLDWIHQQILTLDRNYFHTRSPPMYPEFGSIPPEYHCSMAIRTLVERLNVTLVLSYGIDC